MRVQLQSSVSLNVNDPRTAHMTRGEGREVRHASPSRCELVSWPSPAASSGARSRSVLSTSSRDTEPLLLIVAPRATAAALACHH